MAIRLADRLEPMGDFMAANAEHIGFPDGESLQEKYDNGELGGGGGASYTELSQAEYDALTDDEKLDGKERWTYDKGHIYKRGVEYGKDVDTGTKGLRSNSQYFKIDITKNSASWNGIANFSFNNSTTPTEVTFTITADKVYYTITEGANCIKSVTYTFDSANVVIGVELNGVVYGTQMVEMNTTFGTINSLTNEQFTGANTATQIGVDLELAKGKKVVTTLGKGTWMIGQRIKQDTDFTVTDAQASFEIITKNASSPSQGKYQTAQLYQLTPITDGTNASLSLNVYEDGRAQASIWPHTKDMPPNDYNIVCEGQLNSKLGTKSLVTNAQNFKIVLTKNNAVWYGMFTFNFVYGTTPCEITVTITDKVYYTITKGQNLVSALTYTQDGAKYTIGIDLTAKVYGTQVIDMPSEFGTINSLTAETFAGATTAVFKGYDAKPITELTELGLDGSATIQNVMDKMSIGQHCIINTSRFDDKTQVNNIEYGKVEIRRLSSGMWSLWLEDVLHGNVVAHGTCSSSKFAGWHYLATTDYVDSKVGKTTDLINENLSTLSAYKSGSLSYKSINGICYVSIKDVVFNTSTAQTLYLPVPLMPVNVLLSSNKSDSTTVYGKFTMQADTSIAKLKYNYDSSETPMSGSFSYPLKQ